MKHLFLFVAFAFLSFGASAQTCNKSASTGKACCAAKATTTANVASSVMEADQAMAATNGTVTKRTCEVSGTASYYQKSVCSTSGTVSWDEVKYDASSKKFTKVASASMEKDANGNAVKPASCSKDTKACSAKGTGKACCAAKKEGAK